MIKIIITYREGFSITKQFDNVEEAVYYLKELKKEN